MAVNKKDISSAKRGMNRSSSPTELQPEEYPFALNANIQDEHGNGKLLVQNETSNIKCSDFKTGYKVIGHKYDDIREKTYFFLTNPTTGFSEIGVIESFYFEEGDSPVETGTGDTLQVVLETPLEDQPQTALCNYTTILTDYCEEGSQTGSKCLNFSINSPIREKNIQIKHGKQGDTLWFTDSDRNPQRYVKLYDLDSYTQSEDPCTEEVTEVCLDCNKMRIFPLFDFPCLTPEIIQNGGNLKAGTIEVIMAYSDSEGNALTNYLSITNPIAIHDKNNNILDQTQLDYPTTQAVRVAVENIDISYEYYKVVVIRRSGLDTATSYIDYGVYPATQNTIVVSDLQGKQLLEQSDVIARRPFYTKAKGLTVSNGYLFQHGMETQRTINLQKIGNLLGAFAKWSTYLSKEDLYEDGVNVSNFASCFRDEVYPYAIGFEMSGGYELPLIPLIARPPIGNEEDVLESPEFPANDNTNSIIEGNPQCYGNDRNKRWQFENTAVETDTCLNPTNGETVGTPITQTEENSCIVLDGADPLEVDTIASSSYELDQPESIVDYINNNIEEIKASSGSNGADIRAILNGVYAGSCDPEFGDNCDSIVEVSNEIFALSVESETVEDVPKDYDEYERIDSPDSCSSLVTPLTEDTAFRDAYLRSTDIVYDREDSLISNETCGTATELLQFLANPPIAGAESFFNYQGGLTVVTSVQDTSRNVSGVGTGYTSKLHSNALWFEIDFDGQPKIAVELTAILCNTPDSLTNNSVRVSAFDGCGATNDIASYATVISDMTLANDTDKYIVLDATDFTGNAFIAVDTPLRIDREFEVALSGASYEAQLTGTSGDGTIDIDASNYAISFDTDLDTTASNFVSDHAATILATHGTTVTAIGSTLVFEDDTSFPTLAFTPNLTDLGVIFTPGEIRISIGGNDYDEIFDTDLTTTASNFVSNHGATLDSNNILVSSTNEVLEFRAYDTDYATLSIVTLVANLTGSPTLTETYYATEIPCGCFNIYKRQVEYTTEIVYTNLIFGKRVTYEAECDYTLPKVNDCVALPYKKGLFSYTESTETYPCNDELYNSQNLTISEDDIPASIKSDFESYFVDSIVAGEYVLNSETDFKDKPIRHFKYPDNKVAPFMSGMSQVFTQYGKSVIYPLGFHLSTEVINAFLDIAVNNELLTQEERDNIVSYKIYRGDRRTQKTVLSRGIAFDMYRYNESLSTGANRVVNYSNYPLNALGTDRFNNVAHPYGSEKNNFFSFIGPDTSFYKPTLPREITIDGYQFGASNNYCSEVLGHPTMVILGQAGFGAATTLAVLESLAELTLQIATLSVNANTAGLSLPAALIVLTISIISLALVSVYKGGQYRYQWLETFKNLGQPRNFAYYNVSIGYYNKFLPNTDVTHQDLRGLEVSAYIKEGRKYLVNENTSENYYINNLDREASVMLHTGDYHIQYPNQYKNYDNVDVSFALSSRKGNSTVIGKSGSVPGRVASPYITLKQYLPQQYGEIDSVSWVNTGYCGRLEEDNDCNAAFGGDCFISRFSWKRKLPFFTNNAFGLAPLTPFKYSDYFNINPDSTTGRYFIDYELNDGSESFVASIVFPDRASDYYLDPGGSPKIPGFYVKPPNKFYLYSYGIPYFLVESEINNNYRYGKREAHENFYPNVGDVIDWTQEGNVSIREPNTYFYNIVYTVRHSFYPYTTLPSNYEEETYNKLNSLVNATIYSGQDVSENSMVDPWIRYKALDSFTFSESNGQLVALDGIESSQILARFTKGFTIFGAIDTLRDRLTPETENLGTGGIFAGRPVTFNETQLGYAGTQHQVKISCEFGHFWVDTKRGKVFNLQPGGQGLLEISRPSNDINSNIEKWFKNNLPFKILTHFQDVPTDNNYNGLGITVGWDDRTKRILLTKRDYIPNNDSVLYNSDENYFYIVEDEEEVKVSLEDTAYFTNCSWTVAYSAVLRAWISYYSFLPNYYISYNDYFQTGINYSEDTENEFGLWSHLPFLSSYQVFYGKRYSFIIEYPIVSELTQSVLRTVEYWLDVRKYYNKHNYTDIYGTGFNKAYVYNNFQNSGLLNLNHQKEDNLFQLATYPVHNTDSIDILQSEIAGKWTFNYIYNTIRSEKSGLPIWLYDCQEVEKEVDNRLLNYENRYRDYLRGDYFLVRLINDAESRYKFLFRLGVNDRNFYYQ